MQTVATFSLDYTTKIMLEQLAQTLGENQSAILRRLITKEWKEYYPADPAPTPDYQGEGLS